MINVARFFIKTIGLVMLPLTATALLAIVVYSVSTETLREQQAAIVNVTDFEEQKISEKETLRRIECECEVGDFISWSALESEESFVSIKFINEGTLYSGKFSKELFEDLKQNIENITVFKGNVETTTVSTGGEGITLTLWLRGLYLVPIALLALVLMVHSVDVFLNNGGNLSIRQIIYLCVGKSRRESQNFGTIPNYFQRSTIGIELRSRSEELKREFAHWLFIQALTFLLAVVAVCSLVGLTSSSVWVNVAMLTVGALVLIGFIANIFKLDPIYIDGGNWSDVLALRIAAENFDFDSVDPTGLADDPMIGDIFQKKMFKDLDSKEVETYKALAESHDGGSRELVKITQNLN